MSELNDNPAPSRPRRKRRNYSLLILAAGIFLFGVAAGTGAGMAVKAAKEAGLANTAHIEGGIDAWKKAGGPITV